MVMFQLNGSTHLLCDTIEVEAFWFHNDSLFVNQVKIVLGYPQYVGVKRKMTSSVCVGIADKYRKRFRFHSILKSRKCLDLPVVFNISWAYEKMLFSQEWISDTFFKYLNYYLLYIKISLLVSSVVLSYYHWFHRNFSSYILPSFFMFFNQYH